MSWHITFVSGLLINIYNIEGYIWKLYKEDTYYIISKSITLTLLIGLLIESQTRLPEIRATVASFQPEFRTLKLISCQVILWHKCTLIIPHICIILLENPCFYELMFATYLNSSKPNSSLKIIEFNFNLLFCVICLYYHINTYYRVI